MNQLKKLDYKVEMTLMPPLDVKYANSRLNHSVVDPSYRIEGDSRKPQSELDKFISLRAGKQSSSID
jgi:hypothetical protein